MDVPSVNRQPNSDLEDLASKVPKESGPKPQEVGQVIHGDYNKRPHHRISSGHMHGNFTPQTCLVVRCG